MGKDKKLKRPTLNPDGVSVKGCAYIYAPRGQAGGYAPLAANPYRGSWSTAARIAVTFQMSSRCRGKTSDAGATPPGPDFLIKLRKDAAKYRSRLA